MLNSVSCENPFSFKANAPAKMMLWIPLLIFYLSTAFTLPTVTDTSSLVVSSTEKSKEEQFENVEKEDTVPSVPKIYEMKVDTNVTNRFAKTLITSKVKNLAKTPQEATFAVILPETAYISGFVMEIGGKSYEAYIKEKEEAKQIYDQAVSSGQAAAHVEANARDSNRFTVSVNLEPQSKAIFRLTYEELLQRQNQQYEIVINIHPGQPVKDLNVEVHINETRPLKFVKSRPLRSGNEISKNDEKLDPLAKIDIINSTTASVKFNPDIEKQKQLASGLGTKEENGLSGQFVVQYDVERDPQGGEVLVKDGYFVHFFAPSDLPPLPKQIVFVLDTSGSMDGNRIRQLKEAMNSILDELKKEDVFNIIEFSSTVRAWNIENVQVQFELGSDPWAVHHSNPWPVHHSTTEEPKKNKTQDLPPPFEANENNIKKAKEVVAKLSAYGGTDIKSALETGLKVVKKYKEDNKESKHQPLIVFLTDGEPTVGETNAEKIISSIREANSGDIKSPIFSLSFGDGADRDFLQKISLKNLGFARHIYEAADASLQLQEFYKQISSPLLSDVTFKYVSNVTKLTKTVFPIFFYGSEIVVAGETPIGHEFIAPKIIGSGVRGPIELIPQIEQPVGALERLWAYLTVKQVLEARDAAENKTSYTKKALDLALKYSFVTPVSSLVVVKPNDTGKAVDTEDASKSGNRPYYLSNKNFASFDSLPGMPAAGYGGTSLGFAARPSYNYMRFSSAPGAYGPPAAIQPLIGLSVTLPVAADAYEEDEMAFHTTIITKSDEYDDIKSKLPWLNYILSENGTITNIPGDYKLSTDVHEHVNNHTECLKTPINGTLGICTLLPDCPEVFPVLTNDSIFKEYFCPLESGNIKFVGICCPKKGATSSIP